MTAISIFCPIHKADSILVVESNLSNPTLILACVGLTRLFDYQGSFSQQIASYSGTCVYNGHLGTNHKYPDYQGVLILPDNEAPFGAIIKCVDYAGVLIFKCPD